MPRAAGLRFYVSDYDFKERCDNGSCCGLPASWPVQSGQFTEALLIARREGSVAIQCQLFSSTSERRSQFLQHSLYEAIRWCWNNPKSGNSPYRMFRGILRPTALEADGNVVYSYTRALE